VGKTLSQDFSSIKIEVYSNGKTHKLLKLLFFIDDWAGIGISLKPGLSVPDFVLQLPIFLQSCETKSGMESLGSRLGSLYYPVGVTHTHA